MKRIFATFLGFGITLAIFFGFSLRSVKTDYSQTAASAGVLSSLQLEVGTQPVYAAGSPNPAWGFVRGVAKFTRDVTTGFDTLLKSIESSGLTNIENYTGVAGSNKIEWKSGVSVTITAGSSGALLGPITFTKSLRVFDENGQNMKFELYYNDDNDVLARWMPERTGAGTNANGGIIECQVTGVTGSRTMYCSIDGKGNEFNTVTGGPNWTRALIKVEESAGQYKFTAISDTKESNYDPDGAGTCAAGTYVFPLAFIAQGSSPYQTTAKFGFNASPTVDAGVCGVSAMGNPGALFNYGLFSTASNPGAIDGAKYFVAENQATPPAGYPTGTDVDVLFSTIGGAGAASWSTGTVSLANLQALALTYKNNTDIN